MVWQPLLTRLLPKKFYKNELRKLRLRYKQSPEEFYTKSGIEVVTPDSLETWFAAHKDLSSRWVLQERCSGTGRLSLAAFRGQLPVLFPVDLRYGWGPGGAEHRNLSNMVQEHFRPLVLHTSPPSSKGSAADKKETYDNDMLTWLLDTNKQQADRGPGFINGKDARSSI